MGENKPYCFIQWKGTDVCMDFNCKCGYYHHMDGMYMYYIKCPECGTTYKCEPLITLTEVEKADGNCVMAID